MKKEERLEKKLWAWSLVLDEPRALFLSLSPLHPIENSQSFPEFQEIASKEGERNSLLTTCRLWSPVKHKNVKKDQSFFHETFFFLNRATPLGRTARSCYLSHVLEVIKENEKYEKTTDLYGFHFRNEN